MATYLRHISAMRNSRWFREGSFLGETWRSRIIGPTRAKCHGAERMWMLDMVVGEGGYPEEPGTACPSPAFFRDAVWFDALFKPIDAMVLLVRETIGRDSERSLRINLAAKLEKRLQEVDDLMHRIAAAWEHEVAGEQQATVQ